MYVATNRQKKNAFAKRAEAKAEAAEARAAAREETAPVVPVASKRDPEALRRAADAAAALVHGDTPLGDAVDAFAGAGRIEVPESLMPSPPLTEAEQAELRAAAAPFVRNSESEEYTQAPDIATVPDRGRGRPKSEATEERQRRILELLNTAGNIGMSKPDLAAQLGEKEANVYTALSKLAAAGQVESRRDPETRKYAWYAV